ncbi:hypothetical protein PHYSODRAFT_402483, partial [Phytophthora sojae]
DSQFESVRNMAGIFGSDALRSLAAATPAEQVERVSAFDEYERGLIAHVQGNLLAQMSEPKRVQPKPLRLAVPPFEGKDGEKLHFWIQEIEMAMSAGLISAENLRVAVALSNFGERAKTWAYTSAGTCPAAVISRSHIVERTSAGFRPA